MMLGYNAQTPEVPKSYEANYESWYNTIDSLSISEDAILVGHSAGCGLFLKWLSGNNKKVDKLILVAPFVDPFRIYNDFLSCILNKNLKDRVKEIHIFYSLNEEVLGVKETVDLIRNTYPNVQYHEMDGHGHFCLGEMGTDAFPELLEVIKGTETRPRVDLHLQVD